MRCLILLLVSFSLFFNCSPAKHVKVEKVGEENVKHGKMECPKAYFCAYGFADNFSDIEKARESARYSASKELASTLFMKVQSIFGDHCQGETSDCEPIIKATGANLIDAVLTGSIEKKFYYEIRYVQKSDYENQNKRVYDFRVYRIISKKDFYENSLSVLNNMRQKAKKKKVATAVKAIDKVIDDIKKDYNDLKNKNN